MLQKAIAYVRFSSDEQADGDSIQRQTANVTRYAERYGFSIEQILLDEGRSAYKGEHLSIGELGKFLRAAEKGTFRGYAFLVEEQDRLSRQGTRAAEREKARATGLAVTAKVPAWLKAEVGKKPVAIPEHAQTVARIFELAGLRLGAKKITRTLEAEKRRPFGKNTEWSPEYVQ